MKSFLAIGLITLGCGGNIDLSSGDAGPGDTRGGVTSISIAPEQQLSNSLSTWCAQMCSKLSQCQSPSLGANCSADCSAGIGDEFLGHGDTCAQIGLNYMNCLYNEQCTDLANTINICNPDANREGSACGWSAADASAPNGSMFASVVSCSSTGEISIVPGSSVVCGYTATGCTDGHRYSLTCASGSNNQLTCTCGKDGTRIMFYPTGMTCPDVQAVNSACGWQLAYI